METFSWTHVLTYIKILYISDGCCIEFNIYYFISYILKAAFFWKTMLVFMLKYYTTVSFRQFTKSLNHFFYLASANENLGTCIQVWFE